MTIMIAIFSVCVSIVSFAYSILTNRFVISSNERKNILEWYEKVNDILTSLKDNATRVDFTNNTELLNKLSSLIEVGRFYFPNIDKGDNFGLNKPTAYKGYRNIILDLLVYYYDICRDKDSTRYIKHLDVLRRNFTSYLFLSLTPNNYNKQMKKNSYIKLNNDITLNDFLNQNPDLFKF